MHHPRNKDVALVEPRSLQETEPNNGIAVALFFRASQIYSEALGVGSLTAP